MLSFSNSFAFLLFIIFPIYILLKKTRLKKLHFKFAILNWQTKEKNKKNFLLIVANFIFMLCLCFMILALTKPKLKFSENIFVDNNASVMFLVDVSPSMSITDMSLNGKDLSRLELAKDCIKNFVSENKNIAVGLTLFASESSLIIPETINHKIFLERLATIEVGELGDGTALGTGLATALLHTSKGKNSFLVVLTDGENNAGAINPESAASIISERNMNFFLIGIGKEGQSQIKYTDKLDSKTYTGISPQSFDEATLKKIASSAKGNYVLATSEDTLTDAVKIVSSNLEKSITKKTEYKIIDLEKYFVSIAFVFLCVSWIIKKIFLKVVL